ncbi:polyprenyl synthetase family protein [Sphingobacterium oryzagri]|uniref:Polyprenyl synthetase family protein n=2 Tax=Sphingobacterium oryzagri TaxID=3025669 RepID=A0ABY7WMJ3_9SPHI|nr:polyprenyl synthetase family protein [Sphingobacterium sp. KACC 22765]WDF70822.1 polyprenyl synthetase family protein [Sphingobacterium sp. KACC 22765]
MFQQLSHAKVFQAYAEKIEFPTTPENLYDPIRYILSLSGKRIRPLLVLMGSTLFDEEKAALALPASTAIEYFHNFSLIHDDIMDKAPLRRGQPTVHQKWNDSVGILSGDALLVKAYEELAKCPAQQLGALLRLFNKTALEVCEGQQYDMDFELRNDVTADEYIDMIRLKTSVLLGCALQMGAIVAEADEAAQQLLYAFGMNLGIAFQLQDDLLDVYGDPETFGKQVGGDIISNKKTILFIKLKELVSTADAKELDYLLNSDIASEPTKVTKMKALYARYGIEDFAVALKEKYTATAYEKLEAIDVDESRKKTLFTLADALMHRVQ